jgi:hypothetical protein
MAGGQGRGRASRSFPAPSMEPEDLLIIPSGFDEMLYNTPITVREERFRSITTFLARTRVWQTQLPAERFRETKLQVQHGIWQTLRNHDPASIDTIDRLHYRITKWLDDIPDFEYSEE